MRSLEILKKSNCPVIFDATHSVQLPGAGNGVSLGQRHFVPSLSRAAIAVGISGFLWKHIQIQKKHYLMALILFI